MKYLSILLILLAGCVGSPEPRNPLNRTGKPLWWQKDTTKKAARLEWEKFNLKKPKKDWSNPWADYKQPSLFPDNWRPQPKSKAEKTEDLFRWFEEQKKKDRTI